jgi:hypothetical protein
MARYLLVSMAMLAMVVLATAQGQSSSVITNGVTAGVFNINGVGSCMTICKGWGHQGAIQSGTFFFPGGSAAPFYYCSANARGQGQRGGYNLVGGPFKGGCTVAIGGKEEVITSGWTCLCIAKAGTAGH